MTLPGIAAGFRAGLRGALTLRALAAAITALAVLLLVAMVEKRAAAHGAASRVLQGGVFGLILPWALLWLASRTYGAARLDAAATPFARFGPSRRAVAAGLIAASMAIGSVFAALAAALAAVLAHDPTAPPVAFDALTSAWIGALGAAAYLALFALGSTFGKHGSGRWWVLALDFLIGGADGMSSLFVPRAHLRNLLGGEPPLLFSQPSSSGSLVLLALAFTGLALLRCLP